MSTLLLLLGAALAADPVIDGLHAELERSAAELALPDAPSAHVILYDLLDVHRVRVSAQLGAMVRSSEQPSRSLGVGVRVGTPTLDSANFQARFDAGGFDDTRLVLDDHEVAVRHDAWLLTDRLYKGAVETLAIKEAAQRRRARPDTVPDYAPAPVVDHRGGRLAPVELAAFEALVRNVSAELRAWPQLEWSEVDGAAETGRRVALNSHGTVVEVPHGEVVVRIMARIRAEDGTVMSDHRSVVVRSFDQLPTEEALREAARELAAGLTAWADAPVVEDSYVGPVVFEGDAAVGLFRHLLLPALQGTPHIEKPPSGSRTIVLPGMMDGAPTATRPMRRLLPSGFVVVDDPLSAVDLASGYTHDHEGVPGQRVELVRDGIVRHHLSTCTPSEHEPQSNGHARGFPGDLKRAMPSHTTVVPDRRRSAAQLDRVGRKLAAAYELDHILVVRRLYDPSLSGMGAAPVFDLSDPQGPALPPPMEVVRRYADGQEEPVRGLGFVGVDRRALRDIVAAAGLHTDTLLVAPPDRGSRGPTFGLAVTLTVPTVMLSEVELSPAGGNAEKPPPNGSPLAGAAP